MNIEIGQKALITCDNWFYAPDGREYRAVFGTVKSVRTSEQTLGIKVSVRSQNWYVQIGCMTIAGCQIHYAISTAKCSFDKTVQWAMHEGQVKESIRPPVIFDADTWSAP